MFQRVVILVNHAAAEVAMATAIILVAVIVAIIHVGDPATANVISKPNNIA